MKKFQWLIVAVLIVAGLTFFKNVIAQSLICSVGSKVAHVPVKLGSTNVSFLTSSISLKNLRVHNPSGYPEKLMADIPRIAIDFQPMALTKGVAHFKDVKLDLKEIIVIKNKNGELNVNAIKPDADQKKKADEMKQGKKSGKTKLQIDRLSLSIGRVVYKDFSGGGEPSVQTFDINIKDRTFTNIQNPSTLVSLIMFEALTRTSLSKIANLDLSSFGDGAMGAVSEGLGTVLGEGANVLDATAHGLAGILGGK